MSTKRAESGRTKDSGYRNRNTVKNRNYSNATSEYANSDIEYSGSNFDQDRENGFYNESYQTNFSDLDHHDMQGGQKYYGPINGRFAPEESIKRLDHNDHESGYRRNVNSDYRKTNNDYNIDHYDFDRDYERNPVQRIRENFGYSSQADRFGRQIANQEPKVNFRGKGPKGYVRSDERITDDIHDRLTEDAHIDASDITVTVKEGEVILTGEVSNKEAKRHAEDISESVSGVKNVENRIRLSSTNSQRSKP